MESFCEICFRIQGWEILVVSIVSLIMLYALFAVVANLVKFPLEIVDNSDLSLILIVPFLFAGVITILAGTVDIVIRLFTDFRFSSLAPIHVVVYSFFLGLLNCGLSILVLIFVYLVQFVSRKRGARRYNVLDDDMKNG